MSIESGGTESTVQPSAVRVLVVDDDVAMCRMMGNGLSHTGYQALTANNAEAALAIAETQPPDVSIVDFEMPDVGGLTVIRRLKELYGAAVHVMVLTGHDDEERRAHAFEAGADDFVVKPIMMSELRRRVAAAVRNLRAFVQVRLEKEAAERRLVYGTEATALLAHDLNNGLAVATNNLAYLIETLSPDPEQADALAATLRSVRRMSGLVANFVDIARFEDAAVKPMVQPVDVHELLQSVLAVHSTSLTQGIELTIDCERELVAHFDNGLIERVLHNLFGNASRYCNAGGSITLGARLWETDGAELRVTNTGPQIPENIRKTLFNKYVQGKGGKRGMGLYFCRLVAEAHGGRIEYDARANGPSFVVRLPGRA
ncbi:MAG TPA: response regulator [Kofleriaceae bacterium]|jgi:signal transduction histidine kinase